MTENSVTNEMIYEQLLQLSGDLRQFKQETTQRFNTIEERLNLQHQDLMEFKTDANSRLSRIEHRLDVVYDERKSVTVKFTQAWAGASFGMAVFAALLTVGITQMVF